MLLAILYLHRLRFTMMLTGIKAFEARWKTLKATYPITSQQKHLLMQSMGRLVDNYATQAEIAAELPIALQAVFHKLVDAYLNGFWQDDTEKQLTPKKNALSPAMLAAAERRKKKPIQPTAASEAATYIIHEQAAAARARGSLFSA